MRRPVPVYLLLAAAAAGLCAAQDVQEAGAVTAADVLRKVYDDCLHLGSFDCVRPRVLSFLSSSLKQDTIRITRDLSIVPSKVQPQDSNGLEADHADQGLDALLSPLPSDPAGRRAALRHLLLERVERFLHGHELRAALPQELLAEEVVPGALREVLPEEVRVPLSTEAEAESTEARHHKRRSSFIRKVVLPFILGLKFKTTALIPLALSLIALKTWKALTLGLLSLVLSAAMVIFRFTKPKVVNYDVFHYPQPQHYDHYDHHGYDQAHYDHYDHHSYARSDSGVASRTDRNNQVVNYEVYHVPEHGAGGDPHYGRAMDLAYRAHRR